MERNLLLVSNSKTREQPGVFLGYCEKEIREHFDGVKNILFIPYAEPSAVDGIVINNLKATGDELRMPTSLERRNAYTALLQARFKQIGLQLDNIEEAGNAIESTKKAEGFFFGGGNTFDLLRTIHGTGIRYHLKKRLDNGVPYLGVSAGTVVAGTNICTSNDNAKPTISLDALELIPFNIKPHYLEKIVVTDEQRAEIMKIAPEVVALLDHQGESHRDRIMEYHHDFPYMVVGLREGAILQVKGNKVKLLGTSSARVFRKEAFVNEYEPAEVYNPGDSLDFLISEAPKERVSTDHVLRKAERGPGSWYANLSKLDRKIYNLWA